MIRSIYSLIITPIIIPIETAFVLFFNIFDNYGLAIISMSVVVSFLTLPLYHYAELLQKKEREVRQQLEPSKQRIKDAFVGDEQYMMLSTLYRQQGYHPLYVLRGSIGLLIQIPFFIAAYQFLSHLPQLQGQSFLFVDDLGVADSLFQFGRYTINFLPLVMTFFNVLAGIVYTKGFPLRDKIQIFGISGLFLVLLYNSPSGLLLYWTVNNLFSLVKAAFYRMRRPLLVLYIIFIAGSIALVSLIFKIKPNLVLLKRMILLGAIALVVLIPLIVIIIRRFQETVLSGFSSDKSQMLRVLILSALLLAILGGITIPAQLIESSPIEFSFLGSVESPIGYLLNNLLVFSGLFLLVPLLIFGLSSQKGKSLLAYALSVLSIGAVLNVFLFKGEYGMISNLLVFDDSTKLAPDIVNSIVPVIVFISVALGTVFLISKGNKKTLTTILAILFISISGSGLYATIQIQRAFKDHKANLIHNKQFETSEGSDEFLFSLSRKEDNVIVLFLDRAISSYLPVVFDQFPHLYEQFTGFTYYPNTISFGAETISGAPPIMGGYEYTPDAMNMRKNERLVDKHNEATLVLPRIFANEGFRVDVFEPPFPNYKWADDFTAFRPYPDIGVHGIFDRFTLRYKMDHEAELALGELETSDVIQSRLPLYSLLRMSFPVLRTMLYDHGLYYRMKARNQSLEAFLNQYAALYYLPETTNIDDGAGSYIFLVNNTTHEPTYLQAPDYVPTGTLTDVTTPLLRDVYGDLEQTLYHVNAAALLRVGIWLEFLKSSGVYDNTRIIIVSDHGSIATTPAFKDFSANNRQYSVYNALLLVKDFNSSDLLRTDDEFMTNGDVPMLALEGIVDEPKNPFTDEKMQNHVFKDEVNVYTVPWSPKDSGNTQFNFTLNRSFTVRDNIFDEDSWYPIEAL